MTYKQKIKKKLTIYIGTYTVIIKKCGLQRRLFSHDSLNNSGHLLVVPVCEWYWSTVLARHSQTQDRFCGFFYPIFGDRFFFSQSLQFFIDLMPL